MPVSTFSHDSASVRAGSGGRSELLSRWNSTRERILLDEQRVRESEIQEMDGTGLHERENWPMRPDSTSPDFTINVTEAGAELAGKHHITDVASEREQLEAQYVDDDKIEDIAELPDEAASQVEMPERQRAVLLPVTEEEAPEDELTLEGCDSATSVSPPDADEMLAREKLQGNGARNAPDAELSSGEVSPDAVSERGRIVPASGNFTDTTLSHAHSTSGLYEAPDTSHRTSPSPVSDGLNTPSGAYAAQDLTSTTSPPQRSTENLSASNPQNATRTTQDFDPVRYSWQSSQADDPNRPRINVIRLVSNAASASAGFPQGEAFGFSISAGGRRVVAYDSARLYILQTAVLPMGVSQDYTLKRRPLAVEVVDDGTSLAILADHHTVNIYTLSQHHLKLTRTIKLDFTTYSIALAPRGGLLAVAYDGGVEIFSLDPNALLTDRRAVQSQKMDRLSFSQDGSALLGTTTRINASSSVVVNVPIFPASTDGVPTSEELKEAWCSGLLHPNNIRNSSHATFMRANNATCDDRLFAWNGLEDTFGVLDTARLQYGHVDFPLDFAPRLSTCGGLGAAVHSCPTIDELGDTVAMVINDRTIRLFIIPHKAEDEQVSIEAHSIDHALDEGFGNPFSDARWVYSDAASPTPPNSQTHVQGRLVVTSPGSLADHALTEHSVRDVEGGRIILIDFDPKVAGQPEQRCVLTLGTSPPYNLDEPEMDVADEITLVRRRTVNQSKGGLSQRPAMTLGRAATTYTPSRHGSRNGSLLRRPSLDSTTYIEQHQSSRFLPGLAETNEPGESGAALEEPFTNTAPRSQDSLQRAASNSQRHRFQTLEERVQERISGHGIATFPTLPEYTEEPNAPLPSRFRAMAGLDAPLHPRSRPAVVTTPSVMDRGAFAGPLTAPASTADHFSADQAFSAATRRETYRSSVRRQMPRSLQRAYGNTSSPIGTGPAPSLIGDWENVSPVVPTSRPSLSSWLNDETSQTAARRVSHAPDTIAPVDTPPKPYRHSTSLLSPPGHQPLYPQRTPERRLPPHIQAFRDAAASPSTVPHPVTAWHPPAPSSPAPAPSVPRAAVAAVRPVSSSSRGGKSAFATTAKAKKLGFFRRKLAAKKEKEKEGGGNCAVM